MCINTTNYNKECSVEQCNNSNATYFCYITETYVCTECAEKINNAAILSNSEVCIEEVECEVIN